MGLDHEQKYFFKFFYWRIAFFRWTLANTVKMHEAGMLESIEKGRKLPQFGRSHNVAFFNKIHPLSQQAQCNPTEHFTVFCHLTLPASEGSWHRVPGVTKGLCVHTLVFTFLRGFEGRAALLFFSSPVTNGLWQAPRRSEQNLLELAGATSATCPWGGGRVAESNSVRRHSVMTVPCPWQRQSLFRGPANVHDWKSTEVLFREEDKAWGSTRTGHRSLLTPQLLAKGYSAFHDVPANQGGSFRNERTFF